MKASTPFVLATLAASGLAVGSAQAEVVLIDFSAAHSTAVNSGDTQADTDGNQWNVLGSGIFPGGIVEDAALVDTTNAATPWQVSITGTSSRAGFGGVGINGPSGPDPFDADFAVIDGIYSDNHLNDGLVTITFTGLVENTSYDLSMIGGRATNGEDGVIAVITGTGTGGALLNNGTVLSLSVVSDASGTLAFTFNEGVNTSNQFNGSTLNALSISGVVPEPGSLALLGLGGLLVARRRRG